eukprot:TRINITY_DN127793_c0_g1_i1.p1 TRINITY_DN127793_c0_g1~~TRINITY_DN127793_c0_g1_i1.p1  ORF type:complete len:91 (-),score=43.26 TRINITY_DN127793_c0_g1_i1:84-356(-)
MAKLTVYYSSATGDLTIKKNQQHLTFLLQGKKVAFEEVDVAQLDKTVRDDVYAKANTRTLPLVFKDGAFLGTYDTIQQLAEEEKLDAALH